MMPVPSVIAAILASGFGVNLLGLGPASSFVIVRTILLAPYMRSILPYLISPVYASSYSTVGGSGALGCMVQVLQGKFRDSLYACDGMRIGNEHLDDAGFARNNDL